MILNKSSYERGFGHASMYKTMQVDLAEEAGRDGKSSSADGNRMVFSNKTNRSGELWHPSLGEDGLPEVGSWVYEGDPLYCVVDELSGKDRCGKYKDKDPACVHAVRTLAPDAGSNAGNKASSTLRIPSNPVIGDKFSSRHGQKTLTIGRLSTLVDVFFVIPV